MASREWLDAARMYSRMSAKARAEYWGKLTPDQQADLRAALDSLGVASVAAQPDSGKAQVRSSRGCSSPLAAGCIGMIIGCVITLLLEFTAVIMGVSAVSDFFREASGRSGSSSNSPGNQSGSGGSSDNPCADPLYKENHLEQCDPNRYYYEWRKAHPPEE